MCIQSDKNMFASQKEQSATESELKAFAKYVKKKAWENAGTSKAKLKAAWECPKDDMQKAAAFIAAF